MFPRLTRSQCASAALRAVLLSCVVAPFSWAAYRYALPPQPAVYLFSYRGPAPRDPAAFFAARER